MSLKVRPVVLSTLILHAFGICVLLIFGKELGPWNALRFAIHVGGFSGGGLIVLILSLSRSVRGGYHPKFNFDLEDISRIKSLSLANLL